MKFQKFFLVLLIALILSPTITEVDARSRNIGTNRNRSSKGLIWGKKDFYTGRVIIPTTGGLYTEGYGNTCPGGCAVHGRCGTTQECSVSFWWYVLDAITILVGLAICAWLDRLGYCPKRKGFEALYLKQEI